MVILFFADAPGGSILPDRRGPSIYRGCGGLPAKLLEARIGVEPTNKGFADLCLTTWLPRRITIHLKDSIDFIICKTFAVAAPF